MLKIHKRPEAENDGIEIVRVLHCMMDIQGPHNNAGPFPFDVMNCWC
jgi:hypothetical protein